MLWHNFMPHCVAELRTNLAEWCYVKRRPYLKISSWDVTESYKLFNYVVAASLCVNSQTGDEWSVRHVNTEWTSYCLWWMDEQERGRAATGWFMNKRSLRWPHYSQHVHQVPYVLERDTELLTVCFTSYRRVVSCSTLSHI